MRQLTASRGVKADKDRFESYAVRSNLDFPSVILTDPNNV